MKTRREFFRKLFGAFAGTALAMKVTATNNHVPQRYHPDERLIMLGIEENENMLRIFTEAHSDDAKLSELLVPK